MSSWTILTFQPIDMMDYASRFADVIPDTQAGWHELSETTDYEAPDRALARQLIGYDTVPIVGKEPHEVYAKAVYGDGPDARQILEETSGLWERAVLLRANDTGDTGTATLYEYDGGLVEVDEYSERQCDCCGGRTGRLAAAYMLVEHHIEALADFHDKPYSTATSEREVDSI